MFSNERQKLTLIMYLSEIYYTCGSEILPYNHALYSKVRVRDNLMCNQEIEFPYYSAEVGRKDLCAYCAMEGIQDVNLKKVYKVVLPLCISCMAAGKKTITRMPLPQSRSRSIEAELNIPKRSQRKRKRKILD